MDENRFVFRNTECWLEAIWMDGIFHFNFAPIIGDFKDNDGDSYFIHCTYEPEEENKYWFSFWYEYDCVEPNIKDLTEEEREYIRNTIQKLACINEPYKNGYCTDCNNNVCEKCCVEGIPCENVKVCDDFHDWITER